MHTNVSISENGKNCSGMQGRRKLSKMGWAFVDRILTHGNDLCLLLNPSVNAYRRLDPHFEAPNQIKASAVDRGSMIRIPIGNEKSMRVEVRSVAPDANPYLVLYSIFKSGLDGETAKIKTCARPSAFSPTISTPLSRISKRLPGQQLCSATTSRDATPSSRSSPPTVVPGRWEPLSRPPRSSSTTRSTTSSSGICSKLLQFCH